MRNMYRILMNTINSFNSPGLIPTFAFRLIGMLIAFFLNLLSAQYLGAEGYGKLAFALSLLSVLAVLVGCGLDQVAIKWVSPRVNLIEKHVEIIEFYEKAFVLILTVTICVFCVWCVYVVQAGSEESFIFSVLLSPFVALIALNEAVIRSFGCITMSTVSSQLVRPAVSIVLLLVTFFFVQGSFSTTSVLVIYGVGIICSFLFSLFYVRKLLIRIKAKVTNQLESTKITIISIANHAKSFFFIAILSVILNKADVIMLGLLSSDSQVGIYAVVYNLVFLILVVLQVVNLVIAPSLAKAHEEEDMAEVESQISKSRLIGGVVSFLIFFPLFLFPNFFLLLFGEEFIMGSMVLKILAIGMFVNALFGSVGNYLMMSGYARWLVMIFIVSVLLSLLFMYFLIPPYGAVGAAIAVSFVMVLWNMAAHFACRKIIRKHSSSILVGSN